MTECRNPSRITQTASRRQFSRKINSHDHGQSPAYYLRSLEKEIAAHTATKTRTLSIKSAASKAEQKVRVPSKRRKVVPSKSTPTKGLCSKIVKSKFKNFHRNKEEDNKRRGTIGISYGLKIKAKKDKKCASNGRKSKDKSIENESEVNIIAWDQLQYPVRDICTINCFRAFANFPSIECKYCYCLYHKECVPVPKHKNRQSLCNDCLHKEKEFFHYLKLQEAPVKTPNTERPVSIDPMVYPEVVSIPDVKQLPEVGCLTRYKKSQLQITPSIKSKLARTKTVIASKKKILTKLNEVPSITNDACRAQDDPSNPEASNKYPVTEVSTVNSVDAFEPPSVKCNNCFSLFHCECIANLNPKKIQSLSKDCQSIKTETSHCPKLDETSLTTPNTEDPISVDPVGLPKVSSIPDFNEKLTLVLESRDQFTSTSSNLRYTKLHIPPNYKTEIFTKIVTVSPFTEDLC